MRDHESRFFNSVFVVVVVLSCDSSSIHDNVCKISTGTTIQQEETQVFPYFYMVFLDLQRNKHKIMISIQKEI
jgi:hypothetical protein